MPTGPSRTKNYDVLSELARGGMASVHLARARGPFDIEKRVVIKRILPELASDPIFVRMFLDEARIAMLLNHANIVQVHDVGEEDDAVFYAMEYLHGCDARQIAERVSKERRRIPLDQACAIVVATCAGLHHAHELVGSDGEPMGIVHRDVSPHNVFVTFDGAVKLLDFGIAKAARRLHETAVHGVLRGKFGYIAPEQARGQPVDRRSDVFCIAILLYELCTGERLYTGESEYDILKKIIETDPPPPSRCDPDFPPELERIIVKGLRRRPADRYQTALELQRDLERFAKGRTLDLSNGALAHFVSDLFGPEGRSHLEPRAPSERPLAGAGSDVTSPDAGSGAIVTETMPVKTPRRSISKRVGTFVGTIAMIGALAMALVLVFGWPRADVADATPAANEAPGASPRLVETPSIEGETSISESAARASAAPEVPAADERTREDAERPTERPQGPRRAQSQPPKTRAAPAKSAPAAASARIPSRTADPDGPFPR